MSKTTLAHYESKFGGNYKDSKSFDTWIDECCSSPVMTRKQEREAFREFQAGDEAAGDRIILANQRFILAMAKFYKGHGVYLEDLVMEGNMGMMRAIHKFDLSANVKFCSYAVWWIRQAMQRAVCVQGLPLTLPVNGFTYFGKYRKAISRLEAAGEYAPSSAQIAKESGMSKYHADTCLTMSVTTRRLDAPLTKDGEEGGQTAGDMLESPHCLDDEINTRLAEFVTDRILSDLPARTATVMRMRFGLQGEEKEHTLDEIGTALGISRERVRQIIEVTLSGLRSERKFRYVQEACA